MPQAAKDNWSATKDKLNGTNYGGIFADLYEARWVMLIACGIALITTLVYIKFMDWCAYWLSWLSIFLVLGALVATGTYAFMYRRDQVSLDSSYADSSEATWLSATAWTCWILAAIYLLVMLCALSSLRVAIAVIETAADYFADTKRIIFVPLLYFTIGIITFAMWVFALICVASIGDITVENVAT